MATIQEARQRLIDELAKGVSSGLVKNYVESLAVLTNVMIGEEQWAFQKAQMTPQTTFVPPPAPPAELSEAEKEANEEI